MTGHISVVKNMIHPLTLPCVFYLSYVKIVFSCKVVRM
jgi:hypothetical protein